ncbi:MAG: carboxypeptidase regulatory-like domain-containing protein, partial [Gemmatimonadaceae bacterium]
MDMASRRAALSRRVAHTVVLIVTVAVANAPGVHAQRHSGVPVTGVVRDQTGAVLAGAAVELVNSAGAAVLATTADSAGAFRFDTVPQGAYELRATFAGFKSARAEVRVGTRSPASQQLVLDIANLTDEITVSNAAHVDTSAANNVDAIAVDQNMLESLPIFDQDYIGTISRFLDSGSLGSGGVTLVVNGMEVNALRVSASAVQQIKINQDPYSAEFSRPGRGRIEILTKPGGQAYQGELNVIGRDARFDARNVFAATTPPEQKHIVEGVVDGPLGHGGKTSFLVSASDQLDDQEAIIFAVGPGGVIDDVAPQPNRRSLASGSITRQHSDTTTISIRPSYEFESNGNRGVGGTTVASAGTNFLHREEQVTYNQQSVIRPTLLHQFQILVGHEREPTTSTSAAVAIVVAGAFTGGGAQGDLLRTETHLQLNDSVAWTKGSHLVQAGFQLPDWSRRGFYDHTNAGGTFYFSDIGSYEAATPYAFIQQRGNGDLAFLEKQVGVYIKDDWRPTPSLTASIGLRYDWQNYFH